MSGLKTNRSIYAAGNMLVVLALFHPGAAAAADHRVTVVELFTSQGCSSCPPANANLTTLSRRPDVLALSFAVTYWDSLGWKDSFGRPEFTARQVAYEPPLGRSGPFTPQMVVDGKADAVGNRLSPVETLIANAGGDDRPKVEIADKMVSIGAGRGSGGADVWLVFYDPRTVEVAVGRGENSGRTLPHTNVVHRLSRIGEWDGSALRIPLPAAPAGMKTAVLLQEPQGGAILGAARE